MWYFSKAYLVEKLNTTNYYSWSIKIELHPILNDYFTIVDGSELDLGTANPVEQCTWKQKDGKAHATILLHCGKKQFSAVEMLKTFKVVWNKLKEIYQQTDIATQVTAQKKLSQLAMLENIPIIEFIEKFQGVIDEISILGLTISENQ